MTIYIVTAQYLDGATEELKFDSFAIAHHHFNMILGPDMGCKRAIIKRVTNGVEQPITSVGYEYTFMYRQ